MKQVKILVLFSIIGISILFIYTKSAVSKSAETDGINSARLEDIENAIIIKGIESDSTNSWNENEINNFEGTIIYNNSFNDVKLENNNSKKGSVISSLRRQDNKWHLTSHKIRKGENLWSISKKYDTDYKLILRANQINDPNRLNPGRTILIPNRNGINHKVLKSDTLIALSKQYGVKKELIISQNNIKKNIIKQGEFVFIPDAVERVERQEKIVKYTGTKRNIKEVNSEKNIENSDSGSMDKPEKIADNFPYNTNDKPKIKFLWPLKGEITSAFGKRVDPINNKSKFHCGLDIGAEIGTSVRASAGGEAIFSGWKKGYGRVVILKHKDGFITVYAHNKENIILTGEKVEQGEEIALSGMSGAVTGPHLHFEIRKYVTPLNPYRFLK